ncbi:MAG TPA: hypothetical protein VHZ54_08865 [Solirubrobacterales bacterium]|jgi:hypothetical protein|nr:hypothetical protein [Solirubrobacterales bacterium]
MERERELRLFTVGTRQAAADRAALIVDRLAALRPVEGETPEWRVSYPAEDVAVAFRRCAAELERIDPRWIEVLDFEAVASRPMSEAEFG